MARKHEPLNFAGSLEVQSQKPLDARRKVTLIADLTDAASFPYIYKGLDVFCEENSKWYTFLGGDQTDITNWREEGSGGGGSTDWSDITNKPTDLVQDASYVHTDNNYTTSDKEKLASLENYDDTALAARVTANETAIADRYTKAEADALLADKADKATTYTKTETDALLDGKSSFDIATISTAGGGSEVHATLSQDTDTANINYYKTTELPNALNLNVGDDAFRIPTTGYADEKAAQAQSNAQTYADLKLTQKQDKLVSGQNIKTINNQPLTGEGNLEIGGGNTPYVYWDDAIFGYAAEGGDKFDIYCDQDTLRKIDFKFRNTDPASTPKEYTVSTKVVTDELQAQIDTLDTRVGINIEVGKEKWQGTYTDENGETFQVYSKMVYIPALPATAGITTYDHGVSNIKQILNIYGFTADGFVLNAPRQNAQDNIAIYQASKSASNQTFSIEVGKDRSSKKAYVVMVYAKNN